MAIKGSSVILSNSSLKKEQPLIFFLVFSILLEPPKSNRNFYDLMQKSKYPDHTMIFSKFCQSSKIILTWGVEGAFAPPVMKACLSVAVPDGSHLFKFSSRIYLNIFDLFYVITININIIK